MTKAQLLKVKKELVTKTHVSKKGEPITCYLQTSKNLWCTKIDGRRIYAKNEELLYDKILEVYNVRLCGNTIGELYNLAINRKKSISNVSNDTIKKDINSYNRFIKPYFKDIEINKIDGDILRKHIKTLLDDKVITNIHHLKEFKSEFNLIFEYAIEKERFKGVNPVSLIKNKDYFKNLKEKSVDEKILTKEQLEALKAKIRKNMCHKKYHGYFINGYAILFSMLVGVRVGELCSLKWSDVSATSIHIHTQQIHHKDTNKDLDYYEDLPYTKNERMLLNPQGRYFPLYDEITTLLEELWTLQNKLGIKSQYIFCHEDGSAIKCEAYSTCLRRMCKSLDFEVTNNHSLRMALNSYVLCELIPNVSSRAYVLGHSVETNQKWYSLFHPNESKEVGVVLNGGVTPKSPSFMA